jgi:hypothetical protein
MFIEPHLFSGEEVLPTTRFLKLIPHHIELPA